MRLLLAFAAGISLLAYGQSPDLGAPKPEPRFFHYARSVSPLPRAVSDRMPPSPRA